MGLVIFFEQAVAQEQLVRLLLQQHRAEAVVGSLVLEIMDQLLLVLEDYHYTTLLLLLLVQ